MTSLEKIKLHKPTPTTLLYNAYNQVGVEIVRAMLEHEGFIIVIDEILDNESNIYAEFFNNEYFLFLDKRALSSLDRSLMRLDYFIYFGFGLDNPKQVLEPSVFMEKNAELNTAINLCARFTSKLTYVSSLLAQQQIMNFRFSESSESLAYSCAELQRYSENIVLEKNRKMGIDSRIVRIGETLGEGIDLSLDTIVVNLVKSAITHNPLIVYGDGLDINYLVNVVDAAQGIIKSLFSKKSTGNIYNLAYEEELTTLQIAYKIKEIDPSAGEVQFVENQNYDQLPKIFKFEQNQMEIGWIPRHSLEKSLAESLDYAQSVQNSEKIIHNVNEFDPDDLELAKRKQSYTIQDLETSPVDHEYEYKDNWDRFRSDKVIVNQMSDPTIFKDEKIEGKLEAKKIDFESKFSDSLMESLSVNQVIQKPLASINFDLVPEINPHEHLKFKMPIKVEKNQKISFLQVGIYISIFMFLGAVAYIIAVSPYIQRSTELSNIDSALVVNENAEYLSFTSINKLNESIGKLKTADDSLFLANTFAKGESSQIPLTLKTINIASSINSIRDKLSSSYKTGNLIRYNPAVESFEIYSADKKLITSVYVAKLEIESLGKQVSEVESSDLSRLKDNTFARFYEFFESKYFGYWREITKGEV